MLYKERVILFGIEGYKVPTKKIDQVQVQAAFSRCRLCGRESVSCRKMVSPSFELLDVGSLVTFGTLVEITAT